jgi:hypothetical protein
MNSYHKEQARALSMVRVHLASLPASEVKRLHLKIADYLAFRCEVDDFLHEHFGEICNQKCYQSNLSACCARESIITFFGDVVVNVLLSRDHECLWRVKPIVCEMFLCRQAKAGVFKSDPCVYDTWRRLQQHKKRFTWPDRPVLFDDLERYFIDAGHHSSLMVMHTSPGLLRVKREAKKRKQI